MAAASMLVHVTHIDDSVRGRQGPCVYFWGVTYDRSLFLTMELYLESIRPTLESKTHPLNLSDLNSKQIYCVSINHRWHRATIPELKLSQTGMIEVYCVDSGKTHTVPLIFVRAVDIPGYEAENIRDCPPLASKFLLADVIAPFGLGTHTRQWSDLAMMFLKVHVENEIWKAAPMSMYGAHQAVRLFDSNNQLLASAMIHQGLGVAAQSYHEALAMSEAMDKQPSFMKPAFYSYPAMKLFPVGCNTTALSGTLRPNFAIPALQQDLPTVSPRAYVINNFPNKGRYDVVVAHMEGPFKFFVQMKREMANLQNIRKKLDSIAPNPFKGMPLGSPCIVVSPSDKLFHRGLITGMKDFGTSSSTYEVYFVDVGTKVPVNLSAIYDIPDELMESCVCAYRVSLFGVDKISKLSGLNEIFAALVNSTGNLQAEIVDIEKQEIKLYDNSGRSICDILCSIHTNLQESTQTSNVSSTSTLSLPTNAIPISVVEIPSLSLATEESLFVLDAEKPGSFFGQLEVIRSQNSRKEFELKDLNDLSTELKNAYSTQLNSPLLYNGDESRLGHYGVVMWEEDDVYYRVQVLREMANEVEIMFIDYGNTILITRNKILSPLKCLTRFSTPPYGIHCKLEEEVAMPLLKWKHLIMDKWIKVKIGKCNEGTYSVTFTSDPVNSGIAMKIQNASSKPNLLENVNKQISKIEPTVSAAAVKVPNPIPPKEDRHIRSSENGNFSVTIPNRPCRDEKISEISANETKQHLLQPVSNELDFSLDLHKIDNGASKENDEGKAMDLIPLEQSIKTSQSSNNTSSINPLEGNEKPEIFNQEKEQLDNPESIFESESQPENVITVPEQSLPLSSNRHPMTYQEQTEVLLDQQVEIVFVIDPSSFYVQLLESCDLLVELGEKLNSVYSDESKSAIQDPISGSSCVVKYEEDNGWYRGKIVEIFDPPAASVLFVDYGNIQCSPVEQVKAIDEEFLKLPPLAFHCKLDGVDLPRDWTAEEKSKFESRAMGKLLSATFAVRDSDGKYPVRLVEKTKEGKSVINEDFAVPYLAKIPQPSVGYTSHKVSDKPISVIVSCYGSPLQFFLSPTEVNFQDRLDDLEKFYSSLSPGDLLEDKPSLGLPCVARFNEDGRYYRSQILSIQDETADIRFVDYGNQQDTPLSQLKRITPHFMEFPQMTWHCKLKEVKMERTISADLQKHIDVCFATNEELSALFHPASLDGSNVFEVDLTIPKIGDASRYLIEQKVVDRDILEADVELPAQNVNFFPQQIISTKAVTGFFKSPTEFWVQLEPKAVDVIIERLDKLALDPEFINKKDFIPSIGKPCLAFYEADKHWYRATIEAVKEDCATICYIDYGNSCDVKTCDIRGLPSEFAQQPALAFKCCQDGAENFSEAASKVFEEIILDVAHYSVKFLKVINGSLCVRLSHDECDVGELCSSILAEQVSEEQVVAVVSSSTITQEEECVIEDNLAISTIQETQKTIVCDVSQDSSVLQVDLAMEEDSKIKLVKIFVVFALSPQQFWVQIKNDQDKLNKMQADIVEEYSKNSELLKIKASPVGDQIYAVLHPSYDGWYRAQVTKVCDNDCAVVHFVDYGDSCTVSFANICVLAKHFADIPAFATQCSLNKKPNEWSEAAVEKFITECIDKDCQVVFGKIENGTTFVDSMFVGNENKNIFDLLVGL